MKIGDAWYTTDNHVISQHVLPVSAGNLICRYLISEGKESKKLAEEIKQVAVSRREEVSSKLLAMQRGEELLEQGKRSAKLSIENFMMENKIEQALNLQENSGFGNRTKSIQLAITALS